MRERLRRLLPVLALTGPTLLGIALDMMIRGGSLWGLSPRSKLGYLGSSFLGVGMWAGLLYAMARVSLIERAWARVTYVVVFAFFIFPFSVFAYGVQLFYIYVFNAYITRDTVRLGIEFNGTVASWMRAWGIKLVPAVVLSLLFTYGLARLVRSTAASVAQTRPISAAAAFVFCFVAFWRGSIEPQEFLQSPDASFQAALVGLLHDTILPRKSQGLTYRRAVPVPPIPIAAHRPNVLLVITESVRSDILCSEMEKGPKTDSCTSRFLDQAIPERVGLLKMTTQSSGTITSCMTLWTGLGPDANLRETHTTPFLWEVAKKAGYHTAYIASQDLRAFELGPYLKNAGIDLEVTGEDFGDVQEIHLGCPDERATERTLQFVREDSGPWLVVLHLANTHYPYRVAPDLQPYTPHDDSPFEGGNSEPLKNQIRNSVLLQERTMAAFYTQLRALPSFDDTVTIFVSDHGEQLREHGALFHLNSLFEEEVRIPGFVFAGDHALSDAQKNALAQFHDRRVYGQDVNASILDLVGAFDVRNEFPNGGLLAGRSLFRPPPETEPIVAMSTVSGVWYGDRPVYGVIQGEEKLIGGDNGVWRCYDLSTDPKEKKPRPRSDCAPGMVSAAKQHFPDVPVVGP